MLNKVLAAAAVFGGLMVPGIASAQTPAIVTTDLNIRTGPGAQYQRFGTIPGGTRLTVMGCLRGYNWCDVSWRGERGWVSSTYLAYSGPRYDRRPISSVGVSIGLPIISFEPYAYHGRYYRGRDWYRDRYLDRREIRDDRRDWRDRDRDRDWRDRDRDRDWRDRDRDRDWRDRDGRDDSRDRGPRDRGPGRESGSIPPRGDTRPPIEREMPREETRAPRPDAGPRGDTRPPMEREQPRQPRPNRAEGPGRGSPFVQPADPVKDDERPRRERRPID